MRATPMLTVEEARARILEPLRPLALEGVPLADASGRVLGMDVIAARNVPPFPSSAMDGYALQSKDTQGASQATPVTLPVRGVVPAGTPFHTALDAGDAVRIMTGAPIPEGADAVVPFEQVEWDTTTVRVTAPVRPMANVRAVGEDMQSGNSIITAGTELSVGEIGVLAALGYSHVQVWRKPRVGILATGDEIVPVGALLKPGQIYDANSAVLAAQVQRAGGIPVRLGIAADADATLETFLARVDTVDFMLSSGGISAGDFDAVKTALTAHGELAFWQVNIKPGKPVAFGRLRGVPFLGLPGNPVAAMVNFELFGWSAVRKMQGDSCLERPSIPVLMHDGMSGKPGKRTYVRVHVEWTGTRFAATTTGRQESHLITSLLGANALVIVPEAQGGFHAGEVLNAHLLEMPSLQ